jgi:enoyl-CoA hydratase
LVDDDRRLSGDGVDVPFKQYAGGMEIQRDGEVAVVRLRGGKANAMDEAFLKGVLRLFDEVESSDARAVVVTGYGNFFSAGLAMPALIGLDRPGIASFMQLFESAMRRVFSFPRPVVAAVNGHAIAGGCVLALQCDLRLIADSQTKIGLNEVQLGIGLPSSVIEALRLQLPASSLVPIALEGMLLTPVDAKRLGLVDEVVPAAELLTQGIERARSLARGAPAAVAQIKQALRGPSLERMQKESPVQMDTWLNTWFSPMAQERLRNAVAQLTGKG